MLSRNMGTGGRSDSMVQLSTFNVQQSRGYAIGYATIGIDHRAQGHKGFQILGYLISSSGAYDSDPQK